MWEVSTRCTLILAIGRGAIRRPFRTPHPPMMGTVAAPFSKGVTAMAARGWRPIGANFLLPKWVATHWPNYVEGCQRARRPIGFDDWRMAKNICVADDARVAREDARRPNCPNVFYFSQLLTRTRFGKRLNLFKRDPMMPDDAVTLDDALDRLVIDGDPASVADRIMAFRETTGPFRPLVYAGRDGADREHRRRSTILMAEKLMPLLQDAARAEAA